MTSLNRWKIATSIFALTTVFFFLQNWRDHSQPNFIKPSTKNATHSKRMRSLTRFRIPAGLMGMNENQLLEDLAAANTKNEIVLLCERLAIVGTDQSIESLEVLAYRLPDFSQHPILAMGGIGTDKATDRLLSMIDMIGGSYNNVLLKALSITQNPRAEEQLIAWAKGKNTNLQLAAIRVIGELDSEQALETLAHLTRSQRTDILDSVVVALGKSKSPRAFILMKEIAELGNPQLRIHVLSQMPIHLDEEQQDWVMDMLAIPDEHTSSAAAICLGRAHATDALPALLDAAQNGSLTFKKGAITALTMIGGEEAMNALAELFDTIQPHIVRLLGNSLLNYGGEPGKALLLSQMQSKTPHRINLIYLLSDMSGEEVESLRKKILKNGTTREQVDILSQLQVEADDELLEIVLRLSRNAPINLKTSTLYYLAKISSPKACAAIYEMAQSEGPIGQTAIGVLQRKIGVDPNAENLLLELLKSGTIAQKRSTGRALVEAGNLQAREILMTMARSKNYPMARMATDILGSVNAGFADVQELLEEKARNSNDHDSKQTALMQLLYSKPALVSSIVANGLREGKTFGNFLSTMTIESSKISSEIVSLAASSKQAQTRSALANALQYNQDENSLSVLKELLQDEDDNVQRSALYSIHSIGNKESLDLIANIVKQENPHLSSTALSLLAATGDPRAKSFISDALRSGDQERIGVALNFSYLFSGLSTDLFSLIEDPSISRQIRHHAIDDLEQKGEIDSETSKRLKKEE